MQRLVEFGYREMRARVWNDGQGPSVAVVEVPDPRVDFLVEMYRPRKQARAAVEFVDTGGGISPENMSKIFDPYFTTKASGSGLGLLIVRRIVRDHGGEIDIVNDEGRGITLTIRLPLKDRRVRMLPGIRNDRE